jgi:hypothetical protein
MRILLNLVIVLYCLLFFGCITPTHHSTVRTYINPALNSSEITSVAILPLRNSFTQTSSLSTKDLVEINREFQTVFIDKNQKTTLVNSFTSTELLNKSNLVDSYSNLLLVYTQTGIPNTETLNKIGDVLNVNALIQGFVESVTLMDGIPGAKEGVTTVTFKYIMFSTLTGVVLWEATYISTAKTGTNFLGGTTPDVTAPPVSEAIKYVKDKFYSDMLIF